MMTLSAARAKAAALRAKGKEARIVCVAGEYDVIWFNPPAKFGFHARRR